ncbi:Zn-ribbon domain-containing OB-fold protein [Natrialbaceae archaeon A-CW1-1]
MSDKTAGTAHDAFLAALGQGDGYYLECPSGHATLPPRYGCPKCASPELQERPLPETGTIAASTTIRVPAPAFADDSPYVVAVAEFGSVRLTGRILGFNPTETTVEPGTPVAATTVRTGDKTLVAFELR